MKIISWNCNEKFREKLPLITEEDSKINLEGDIYVIPECENPDEDNQNYKKYKEIIKELFDDNYYWIGNHHYKGLGIFAKKDIELKEIETSGSYEFFKAFRVNDTFNLLAIWVQDKNKEKRI